MRFHQIQGIPLSFLTRLSNDHNSSLLVQFTISFYFDPLQLITIRMTPLPTLQPLMLIIGRLYNHDDDRNRRVTYLHI